jgi:hypothetical protein
MLRHLALAFAPALAAALFVACDGGSNADVAALQSEVAHLKTAAAQPTDTPTFTPTVMPTATRQPDVVVSVTARCNSLQTGVAMSGPACTGWYRGDDGYPKVPGYDLRYEVLVRTDTGSTYTASVPFRFRIIPGDAPCQLAGPNQDLHGCRLTPQPAAPAIGDDWLTWNRDHASELIR